MAIEVKAEAAIPEGKHAGVIIGSEETTKVFDPSKGPEDVVAVTIQPEWRKDESTQTLPVEVVFAPKLNGLSALSAFLDRIGQTPEGGAWEASAIVGTEVEFVAKHRDNGFVNVVKDSIKARA